MCARGGVRAGRGGHGHPHRLKGAGGAPTRGAQRRMRGWDVASPPPPPPVPKPAPALHLRLRRGRRGARSAGETGGGGEWGTLRMRGGRRPAGLR